jgi:hypothetical protein
MKRGLTNRGINPLALAELKLEYGGGVVNDGRDKLNTAPAIRAAKQVPSDLTVQRGRPLLSEAASQRRSW